MVAFPLKPSVLLQIVILVGVIALWQFPFVRFLLMMILLLFSIVRAFAGVLAKHRGAHLQGRITSAVFVRNTLIEMSVVLLGLILAAWLGRFIAQMATKPISDPLTKQIAGMITGLLVGVSIGMLVSQAWGRLVRLRLRAGLLEKP